ncbi:hypothetical protein L2729_11900 [Shewanella gelidimarina]|uniref:hypothetical protein n=1 Tax=Shewanella gelidimarina TaxID=56813 RepID=UPI00200F0308|nr:hypothetical protein [Shewanella gelidimarina]MCL1058689.1 hypothetical protein [Shewanella gelidimarina]
MKSPYQLKLQSLGFLLNVLLEGIHAEVELEDKVQLSNETELAYLTYVLNNQLSRQSVSDVDQTIAMKFVEQYFSSLLTTHLVNHEDKLTND